MNRLLLPLLLLSLTACQTVPSGESRVVAAAAPGALEGAYDNHEQVWTARETAAVAPPHVVVAVEATARPEWTIWRVRYGSTPEIDAVWAMRRVVGAYGVGTLVPHRPTLAAPATGRAFDERQWTALDACTLRGEVVPTAIRVAADAAACAALAPGVGAQAALLPLQVEHDGEWLRLRLYADQARGPDAREAARKVQVFGGWAAISGGGPNATPGNDWHMNRDLRLGNEGGRAALVWRDGKPSGYSLGLERLTYREGDVPVLKLSILDDASGRTLAYAWANPEATRIGINLGWMQVGLQREAAAAR